MVLKIQIGAIGRKEGAGFQIFNGFDHPVEVTFRKIKKISALVAIAFILACPQVRAEIPPDLAARAIVGEASGEGYISMLAHAHALRNRGTLHGVHGYFASHIVDEKRSTWKKAYKAWRESKNTPDPTHGASCWFSKEDLMELERKKPEWFMKLRKTVKIGSVTFFRDPNR